MKTKKIICMAATLIMTVGLLAGCGTNNNANSNTNSNANAGGTVSSTVVTTKAATEVTSGAAKAADDVKTTEAAKTTDADKTAEKSDGTQAATTASAAKATEAAKADTKQSRILVVYYSATGSTRAVAQTIAGATGADIFDITPVQPYTSDDLNWNNGNSRVSKEHNNESLRDVALTQTTPANWDSYDTVFVGYPIWWYIAAWPVNNFVKGNDFSGKTVIPFCTSASSGIGNSGQLLQKMAGTGNWQAGQRFSSGASASDVQTWVNSLNLKK